MLRCDWPQQIYDILCWCDGATAVALVCNPAACSSANPPRSWSSCVVLPWLGRERQPWEAADGAVYLARELAAAAPDAMSQLLPALADAVRHSHYAHACHLQASSDLVLLAPSDACTVGSYQDTFSIYMQYSLQRQG
jgi:hypothetical protein